MLIAINFPILPLTAEHLPHLYKPAEFQGSPHTEPYKSQDSHNAPTWPSKQYSLLTFPVPPKQF